MASLFVFGLKLDIKLEVQLAKPIGMVSAYRMTCARETIMLTQRNFLAPPNVVMKSFPSLSTPLMVCVDNVSSWIMKRLTPTHIQERKDKGLCFNYDEKYMGGHIFPATGKTLLLNKGANYEELDKEAEGLVAKYS